VPRESVPLSHGGRLKPLSNFIDDEACGDLSRGENFRLNNDIPEEYLITCISRHANTLESIVLPRAVFFLFSRKPLYSSFLFSILSVSLPIDVSAFPAYERVGQSS